VLLEPSKEVTAVATRHDQPCNMVLPLYNWYCRYTTGCNTEMLPKATGRAYDGSCG